MNKEKYIEARENAIMELIDALEEKQGSFATQDQIDQIESSVTESDIIAQYSNMVDSIFDCYVYFLK